MIMLYSCHVLYCEYVKIQVISDHSDSSYFRSFFLVLKQLSRAYVFASIVALGGGSIIYPLAVANSLTWFTTYC